MDHKQVSFRIVHSIVNYKLDQSCNQVILPNKFLNDSSLDVSNVKIVEHKVVKFKTTELYINSIINYIKDNIIKYCNNLKSVTILINAFDQNNIFHKFIMTVSNIINDLLQIKEKINFKKNIFIIIIHENKLIFCGNLDFSYL